MMIKLRYHTCKEIVEHFETYLWDTIEKAVNRHDSSLNTLSYLFEIRSMFKEMEFLEEDLTCEHVRSCHKTSELYCTSNWIGGIERVAHELEEYWDQFLQIAMENERKNDND